jgi:CHAT domain-containing protein
LTLDEIWSIGNLAGCRLVTLSACNTAVSDEVVEGWPINPANAFLQVGVPRVLATLWQVDDKATSILMHDFYSRLPELGAADALAEAQRNLAATQEYGSPYFWAPFILLGDWR